ncbi:MAG: type III-A CRISPR-associated protein Cas10/Csm1 [Desulfobacteraceae bacterium]|nr:type III-A CRISPR-associated protein Cas10/Csm1 [Desulfobacteraceae bacterium]MBC2719340.1 type III-A CRISPR-associated protein Cas10/Csm1 [Desulfobacteraceae bacterium]
MNRIEPVLKAILIEGLQKVREWFLRKNVSYLRSIFDQVGFIDADEISNISYVPPYSLTSEVIYPVNRKNPLLDDVRSKTYHEIFTQHHSFNDDYLAGLPANKLLFLLEKFGGTVPVDGDSTISIFDMYKIMGAKAIVRLNRKTLKHEQGNLIINIDLSGIQRFIYNIVSRGALKNLRSRSFFIELLCGHTVNRVINSFNLHHINVLINGGGNVKILSSKPSNHKELLDNIDRDMNLWLSEEFNGRLNLVLTSVETSGSDINGDISKLLNKISTESFIKKNRKFDSLIQRDELPFVDKENPGFQRCEICGKDFTFQAGQKEAEHEGSLRCAFCDVLVRLGMIISKTKYIYISEKDINRSSQIKVEDTFYFLSDKKRSDLQCAWVIFEDKQDFHDDLAASENTLFARNYIIKNEMLPKDVYEQIDEKKKELKVMLKKSEDSIEKQWLRDEIDSLSDEHPAMLEHLANSSEGAKLIGALRMDADNIGKILYKGFYGNATLEKVSSFSRNLNYFFKLYLESTFKTDTNKQKKRFIHVIYAGGDDLFALGAWNDIAELSLCINKTFGKYTCQNIDLGLSAGFTIHKSKFPVSKMADLSLVALNYSKDNLEPCWFCRKKWLECPLFRNGNCLRKDSVTPFFTEYKAALKYRLDKEFILKYSSEPSRLKLSCKRKRFIKELQRVEDEVEKFIVKPFKIFTANNVPQRRSGFMHNALNMLEVWYSDGLIYLPKIAWLLQKQREELQRIIEKDTKESMYDLYDQHLHLATPRMLSALHIPLSWAILLMKEGGKKR